jgi:hypothetical protein
MTSLKHLAKPDAFTESASQRYAPEMKRLKRHWESINLPLSVSLAQLLLQQST